MKRLLALGAVAALLAGCATSPVPPPRAHRRAAGAGDERLPRPSAAAAGLPAAQCRRQRDPHRRGRRRGAGQRRPAAARRAGAPCVRRRRRPDRRLAAAVGAVQGRADDRVAVADGAGSLSAVGNHEFDKGLPAAALQRRLSADGCKGPGMRFQYLAASTVDEKTGPDAAAGVSRQDLPGHPGGLHRPDAQGHADHRGARRRGRACASDDEAETVNRWCPSCWRQGIAGHRGADPRRRRAQRGLQRVPGHQRPHRRHRARSWTRRWTW
jgi:hypothetical protein